MYLKYLNNERKASSSYCNICIQSTNIDGLDAIMFYPSYTTRLFLKLCFDFLFFPRQIEQCNLGKQIKPRQYMYMYMSEM